MGNKGSRLKSERCESVERFLELKMCNLVQVALAKSIWMEDFESKENLEVEEFNDVFGHVMGDTSLHYHDFLDANNPYVTEEDLLDGVVSGGAITLLGLVCNDTVKAKLRFVFSVYSRDCEGSNDPQVAVALLPRMLCEVIMGMQTYFRAEDHISSQTVEIFVQAAMGSLPMVPLVDPLDVSEKAGPETHSKKDGDEGVSASMVDAKMAIKFSDFWDWVQDTSDISLFLDPIFTECFNKETIGNGAVESAAVLKESKLKVDEDEESKRPRNPLWSFQLHDMIDEFWTSELPEVNADDVTVMSALELLVLTGRFCLPVSAKKLAAQTMSQNSPMSSPIGTMSGMESSLAGAMRRKSTRLKGKYATGEELQFIGVIDLYTVMLLLAETCPDSLLMPIEAPSKIKKALSRKMSARSSESLMMNFLQASSGIQEPDTSRARRESFGVQGTANEWQKVGELFARMTLRDVMEKRLSLEDFVQQTTSNGKQKPMLPSTKASITYKPTEILMPHSFLFAAVLMLAKGYRNIPISFDEKNSTKIDHVLSEMDFIRFYRKHPEKLLGEYRNMPISTCGLMTIPLCIPTNVNLGTALIAMSQRGINAAALIDDDDMYCGRVSQNNILELWFNWRLQTSRDGLVSIDAIQNHYNSGIPGANRLYSTTCENYNFFQILTTTLKNCFTAGIHPQSLSEVHKSSGGRGRGRGGGGAMGGMNMNIIEEGSDDSDSDSNSSSSSCSSSSSSSNSSDSDSRNKKNKKNESATGRASMIGGAKRTPPARRPSSVNPPRRPSMARPSMARKSSVRQTVIRRGSRMPSAAKQREIERQRMLEEEESSDDDWEDNISPEQEKNRRTSQWFYDMGVIQPTDTVQSALDAMIKSNSSKTFVVEQDGSIVGAVDFMKILRKLLRFEEESSREYYFSTLG
jgi:CBS domain-containing protein